MGDKPIGWNVGLNCQCTHCGALHQVNAPLLAEGVYFAWRCPKCSIAQEFRVSVYPADESRLVEAAHA